MRPLTTATVSAVVLTLAIAGCGGESGRTVTLEAWPQVGRTIEVVAEVNGTRTVETADDERWSRSIRVDGDLNASLVVVDPEGQLVRCSIDLGEGDAVAAVGNGEARCAVTGEVDEDRVDVDADRFGAVRPPPVEDDVSGETASVEILESALFADVPGSWTVATDQQSEQLGSDDATTGIDPDLGANSGDASRFSAERLDVGVRLSDPDSRSSVAISTVRGGSTIDDPLGELLDELRTGTNPNDAGTTVAFGAARLGDFDAVRSVIDVPGRRISWFLLRVDGELIAVTAVDVDLDGDVDDVLQSFRSR